jgi:hypothetical protein
VAAVVAVFVGVLVCVAGFVALEAARIVFNSCVFCAAVPV